MRRAVGDFHARPRGYAAGAYRGRRQRRRRVCGPAAAPATPAPPSLQQQLEESVRRTAPGTPRPAAPTRPAPTRPAGPVARPMVPRMPPAAAPSDAPRPADALSPARVNRLMALLHEAVEAAEVPPDQ